VLRVGDNEREPDDLDDRGHRDDYDDRPDYERPHRGGMILAFGIISLVMCQIGIGIVFGILAWVMGNSDLRGMAEGEVDPEGKQLTQVGKILGMVACAFLVLGACLFIAYIAVIGAVIGAGAAK
jgi:hypothetical protein